MLTTRPRGTKDVLPEEIEKWRRLEDSFRGICEQYGFREIRTPIFEHTELFERGVGATTDIVSKEMYTFLDRGKRSITLRPEGTAPVVRALLENNLHKLGLPQKLYYLGPMFRYDRPQAGRFRQFHQLGVEVFGSEEPAVDAEVMALAMNYFTGLGLQDVELHLNSLGCLKCRGNHRNELYGFLKDSVNKLCKTCRERFDNNPMRVLDCKNPDCRKAVRKAPAPVNFLCGECLEHFHKTQDFLHATGVDFVLDDYLVRGLDYYTRTSFEFIVKGIGAQNSIGGGGRYDELVAECGGPRIPGMGFGLGVERILLTLSGQGFRKEQSIRKGAYIVTAGEELQRDAFILLQFLRGNGIAVEKDYMGRSLRAQLKQADRKGVRYAVILGEEEKKRGTLLIRDMVEGTQKEVCQQEAVKYLM